MSCISSRSPLRGFQQVSTNHRGIQQWENNFLQPPNPLRGFEQFSTSQMRHQQLGSIQSQSPHGVRSLDPRHVSVSNI